MVVLCSSMAANSRSPSAPILLLRTLHEEGKRLVRENKCHKQTRTSKILTSLSTHYTVSMVLLVASQRAKILAPPGPMSDLACMQVDGRRHRGEVR